MKIFPPPLLLALGLFCVAVGSVSAQFKTISPKVAKDLLEGSGNAVLLDVRTRAEYLESRIPGSIHLPYDQISAGTAAKAIPSKDSTVIVYCRSGRRSLLGAASLYYLGYANVLDMGGILSWPYEVELELPRTP